MSVDVFGVRIWAIEFDRASFTTLLTAGGKLEGVDKMGVN